MSTPRVSIVMAVYNGQAHLKEALDSLLDQTFTDFEVVLVNDGSTDDTHDIITSYTDSRIHLHDNPKNLGLIASLNTGLALAKGEYIARMDADDVALPARLERQVKFLDTHPHIGVCGTWIKTLGAGREYIERFPVTHAEITSRLLFTNALAHPTVMFRAEIARNHHLTYSADYPHAEDYAFWVAWSKVTQLANLPEVLLRYRIHPNQIGATQTETMQKVSWKIQEAQLKAILPDYTAEEAHTFRTINLANFSTLNLAFAHQADAFLRRLVTANRTTKVYNQILFEQDLAHHFLAVCSHLTKYGFGAWQIYATSPLRRALKLTPIHCVQVVVLFVKALFKLERIIP
jgi:glycosyltransferase involved in cell wall biosynthesis